MSESLVTRPAISHHAKTSLSGAWPKQRSIRVDESSIRPNQKYKVDAAYRSIKPTRESIIVEKQQFGVRRLNSADLLNEMIHRMGGAESSNARGTFVDIAI
jgi:hypothetical protein